MNVIRLLFIWEAFEPRPGALQRRLPRQPPGDRRGGLVARALRDHRRPPGRLLARPARGCGCGFPAWAISPRARSRAPDNGCDCKNWVFHEVTDPNVHRSFADFYADTYGVRTRYLAMLDRIAAAFATVPGVIGYDPLNEPWGDEAKELAPLYRDAAAVLRARHPTAILFLAGHATTGNGKQTRMPRPAIDNFAYSPHYYTALVVVRNGWHGGTSAVDRGFATMRSKADEWGVPLFVGEFGIHADAGRAGDYISLLYDRLDARPRIGGAMELHAALERCAPGTAGTARTTTSSTPRGRPGRTTDRVLSPARSPASPPVPVSRGGPAGRGAASRIRLAPPPRARGDRAIRAERLLFPPGSTLQVQPAEASCRRDLAGQRLICRAGRATMVRVISRRPARIEAPDNDHDERVSKSRKSVPDTFLRPGLASPAGTPRWPQG